MSRTDDPPPPHTASGSWRTTLLLLTTAIAIPILAWLLAPRIPALGPVLAPASSGTQFPVSTLPLERMTIGPAPSATPQITHVQIIDFDQDGANDVIACDAQRSSVLWYRREPDGDWAETVLGEHLVVPAHATVADVDRDGDPDVLVAILGNIWPDDGAIGRLVLLENRDGQFVQRILLDNVRRVADVQADDLDGDADIDLVVAVFGYARGSVVCLENVGELEYRERELIAAPGAIHVLIADYDADGDRDVTTIVSQDEEALWGFENLGDWKFQSRRLFWTPNFDLGSAGLVQTDLDADGDVDLLLPVGDNFEDQFAHPQPYHGCLWFENRGQWEFTERRIATFGGTYAAAPGDLDADGDLDVVLVSMSNDWDRPENPSIAWLENDGRQNFRPFQIAGDPIHLVTVACGDLDGDGCDDIVAGGLHVRAIRPTRAPHELAQWRVAVSRSNHILMLVILAEVAITSSFLVRRGSQPRPPLPNLARLDATTAAEVRALRSRVTSDDSRSWQNLGDACLAFGFFAEADACYGRAAEIGPPTHDLLLRWGVCLDRLGRIDVAIAKYEQAAAAAEGRPRAVCRYHIARCYLRNRQVELALETLLQAGDFELAQYELANVQSHIGRADAAAPILDALLQRYPDELKLNLLRAKVAEQLGDAHGARRFRDHAERSQDNLFLDSTVEYIGLLRVAHGLPRERARCAELEKAEQFAAAADGLQATQLVEWDLAVARRLVRLNFRLGRVNEATAVLGQMIDRFGESPEFLEQQGDAAFLLQRADDAADHWQRAADLRPNARLHQLLADYHAQRGAIDQAQFHRARMAAQLGLASYRKNQLPAAIEHLSTAVALDPQQSDAWFWLGQSQRASVDAASARASYARCIELQPHHGRALDELARLSDNSTAPPN